MFEGTADTKIKTQYHFLLGKIARLDKEFKVAYDNLKLAEGNSAIKTDLGAEIQQLTSDIVNAAIEQSELKILSLHRAIYFWRIKWTLRPMKTIFTMLLLMQ